MKRLNSLGAQILTTMECGNIVFVSDGEQLTIHTDNGITDRTEEAA